MSSDFFKVKKGLNISPSDSSTVTSPEVGDIIVDSSDNNKLKRYDDLTSSWKDVGSGVGGINYISNNSDFEGGTVGYTTYADAVGEAPVDGTGGTATFVSIGTDSVSPLRGTKSGLISKTANNAQGQGVSYDFTIDAADQAQVLRISFDYNTEASTTNYADGDIRVYVYDVTNSRLIEVIDRDLLASSQGKFVGTFQSSPDSLSYRLIFHIAGTGITAWTVEVDNVIVGPQTIVKGAIVTDWEDITTYANTNLLPINGGTLAGSYSFYYQKRNGENLEINFRYQATAVGSGTNIVRFPIQGIAKYGFENIGTIQSYRIQHTDPTDPDFVVCTGNIDAGVSYFTILKQGTGSSAQGQDFIALTQVYANISIPIQGWSSNVTLSEDAGNREVVVRGAGWNVSGAAVNLTTDIEFAELEDTTSSWDGSKFIAPETGKYSITGNVGLTPSQIFDVYFFLDGSSYRLAGTNNSSSYGYTNFGGTISLTKDQVLSVRIGNLGTPTLSTSTSLHWIHIQKLSSPQTIAASEVVAEIRENNAGSQIQTTFTQIPYPTTIKSTHGSWSSNSFTAPVSGIYHISFIYQHVSNSERPFEIRIRKSSLTIAQTAYRASLNIYTDGSYGDRYASGLNTLVELNKGESIYFESVSPTGVATLNSAPGSNRISIFKVG